MEYYAFFTRWAIFYARQDADIAPAWSQRNILEIKNPQEQEEYVAGARTTSASVVPFEV